MSTLQMLDVAIGIVFIFLLLSLICTALNEIVEGILKKRASDLEQGIRELLQDYSKDGKGKVAELYQHSLIAGLYKGPYVPFGKKMPSYIPASTFALALLDNILPASPTNLSGSVGGGTITIDGGTTDGSTTDGSTVQTPVKSLAPLRNAISTWPDSHAQKALYTLIDAAGDDIDKARENIEGWYNSSMDRVSGWYKRRVHTILIGLGLLMSVIMNMDTIAVFKSLMNDPPLRNSLVAAAQEYAKTSSSGDTSSAVSRVKQNAKQIYDLRLPVGWDWKETDDAQVNKRLAIPWANNVAGFDLFRNWFFKIIGWLITALAVSLGAPFWFDTLNKVMVIRSTVKPREKSQDEASEDRQMPKVKNTGK